MLGGYTKSNNLPKFNSKIDIWFSISHFYKKLTKKVNNDPENKVDIKIIMPELYSKLVFRIV